MKRKKSIKYYIHLTWIIHKSRLP